MRSPKYCNAYKIMMIREVGEPRWKISDKEITSPADTEAGICPFFYGLDREVFLVIALNVRNVPTAWNKVSIGSVAGGIVHPREVFKFAILANAFSIILAHNHPSGNPEPSKDDLELTRRLVKAGQLMGIKVLDHMIFGDTALSLKERGLM